MEISYDTAVANMYKIKSALGLPDVYVEHPCFLSITVAGREFHAGYSMGWDESLGQESFEIYEFTDGYNIGRVIELLVPDTFQELADTLKSAVFVLLNENAEIYALTIEH